MKRKLKIDYFPLTEEELREYKTIAKRSLIIRCIFFIIFLPGYVALSIEALELPFSYIRIIIYTILYIVFFFITYFIYFAFKPIGIRYGRISKRTSYQYRYYGKIRYNVYLEDIHKSLTKVKVNITKEHPVARLKDKVKVIKTKFGLVYIYVYEYYDEEKQAEKDI